ncbi:MAG: methylcrotonoyl-CoA carboxylase, partial [Pseudomonadota bacterium]
MKIGTPAAPNAQDFVANRSHHLAALEVVRQAAKDAAAGGGQRARDRHVARGKMLPRDRVAHLLDP